jgi:hypothetical protein
VGRAPLAFAVIVTEHPRRGHHTISATCCSCRQCHAPARALAETRAFTDRPRRQPSRHRNHCQTSTARPDLLPPAHASDCVSHSTRTHASGVPTPGQRRSTDGSQRMCRRAGRNRLSIVTSRDVPAQDRKGPPATVSQGLHPQAKKSHNCPNGHQKSHNSATAAVVSPSPYPRTCSDVVGAQR